MGPTIQPPIYVQPLDEIIASAPATPIFGAQVESFGAQRPALTLVTTIQDALGKAVAADRAPVTLAPGQASAVDRSLTITVAPISGRAAPTPYLYRVVSELREGTRVIDRQVQPLGIRNFVFDPDQGLVLNGKITPLHGVSRHQDVQDKSWAPTPEDHASDMAFALEIGANTIHYAHYQHAQEWSDAADKAGMVVWAELPFVHEANVEPSEAPAAATIANADVIASLEPDAAKGASRSFAVWANDQPVIARFAPGRDAGGMNKAAARSFPVTSSGGRLVLEFHPVEGDAIVAGIAIRPR